ncbi:MAG: acyl-CoA dehydrogenase family protein, partial [Chloroflexota bacterium]|nr:acyl-CoA dehydrogenase family protein [Chloroflexota bacterium]
MELSFTEEQEMLRKSAHDFLANECPPAVVRDAEQDERGYPQELWQKMADLGWMGLVIPDEYDGTGQSFFDLIILLEEMGRAVLPGPFFSTVVLGALPLLIAGSDEQKRDLLPKIANGKLIMTTATFELNADVTAEGVTTTAKEEIENYVLNGTKLLVPYAHVADYIICAARTKALAKSDEGITLFLV